MGVGETAQFIIPPDLAFGADGMSKWGVPANATLCLNVTLVQYVSARVAQSNARLQPAPSTHALYERIHATGARAVAG